MALLLVFLLLFGFAGFGMGSTHGSSMPRRVAPYQSPKLRSYAAPRRLPRDRCGAGRFRDGNHRKPLPLRFCAIRSGVSP